MDFEIDRYFYLEVSISFVLKDVGALEVIIIIVISLVEYSHVMWLSH